MLSNVSQLYPQTIFQQAGGRIRHIPLKRIFDVGFSLLVLVLGSPLYLLIGMVVRLTSPGGVFFHHRRIGRGGRPFNCLKFRTMYQDGEGRLKRLLEGDPKAKGEWERHHKLRNDPRVTPVGKFLRRTSLDELPQFWNVLVGDLSVVGPRPQLPEELAKQGKIQLAKLLTVRPGITGIWQTRGRSQLSYNRRVRLDQMYVRHRSLWLDMRLVARTVPAVIRSRGAY